MDVRRSPQARLRARHSVAAAARRVRHYLVRRARGYDDRGSLDGAARAILHERAERGFRAGSHFPGLWPRDLCVGAAGFRAAGLGAGLGAVAGRMVEAIDDVFYTDFHADYAVATPAEGVDTFPALVILLDRADALSDRADGIARLAALHRRKFFDDERYIVTGRGSAWWDSAAGPREGYNTAMLLAAIDRLEDRGIGSTYTGLSDRVREGMVGALWNGRYFAEWRGSGVLACDANVVPLYFGLVDPRRARRIADALCDLETPLGVKMRSRPFRLAEVRPEFLLHPDYHYHIWPWNSLMLANGLARYGFLDRASSEADRIERLLDRFGNFLEVVALDGKPYMKRGYASAQDFTVAAALWTEYRHRMSAEPADAALT